MKLLTEVKMEGMSHINSGIISTFDMANQTPKTYKYINIKTSIMSVNYKY